MVEDSGDRSADKNNNKVFQLYKKCPTEKQSRHAKEKIT